MKVKLEPWKMTVVLRHAAKSEITNEKTTETTRIVAHI
jgi:hypothetical protein